MTIVVAGEALIDRVSTGGVVADAFGGAPYNSARALSRLGLDVEFVGSLSTDRFGVGLRDQLVDDGVDVTSVQTTDAATTMAIATISDGGGASYEFSIGGTSAPRLEPFDLSSSPAPDVFVSGGLGLVLRPMADSIEAAAVGMPVETLVAIDVNCRPAVIDDRAGYLRRVGRVAARADVIKVSDEDLEELSPDLGVADFLDAGARAVIVTAGSSSTRVVTPGGVVDIPVPPIGAPVIDTIGAGDTFCAALIGWWVLSGLGRHDLVGGDALDRLIAAVTAAHAAAAVVVTRRGCDPPHLADLPAPWPP